MKVSLSGKMIATADTLGKIKIVEFPNIYNMLTVLLYNNEDIKFCDFVNNQNLLVINSSYELHLWNINDFQLKSKFDMKSLLDISKEESKTDQSQALENKETLNEENKREDENLESANFCHEDDVIKNIFFIEGTKIILQIGENVNSLKEAFISKYILFEISDLDQITFIDSLVLKDIPSEENSYLFISNNTKQLFFLKYEEINNEKNLNIVSKLNIQDLS